MQYLIRWTAPDLPLGLPEMTSTYEANTVHEALEKLHVVCAATPSGMVPDILSVWELHPVAWPVA